MIGVVIMANLWIIQHIVSHSFNSVINKVEKKKTTRVIDIVVGGEMQRGVLQINFEHILKIRIGVLY